MNNNKIKMRIEKNKTLLSNNHHPKFSPVWKVYRLYPSHFLSVPALSWMQWLVWNNWAWTYFRCRYAFILWESMRRGVFYISKKYSKTNNKYSKSCQKCYHNLENSKFPNYQVDDQTVSSMFRYQTTYPLCFKT